MFFFPYIGEYECALRFSRTLMGNLQIIANFVLNIIHSYATKTAALLGVVFMVDFYTISVIK